MCPCAEGSRDGGFGHAVRIVAVLLIAAAGLGCGSSSSPGMGGAGNGGHAGVGGSGGQAGVRGSGGNGGIAGSGGEGGAIGCSASTQPSAFCCTPGANDPLPYRCDQNTGEWVCGGYPSTPSGICLNNTGGTGGNSGSGGGGVVGGNGGGGGVIGCPESTYPPGACCGREGQIDPIPYGCDQNSGEWICNYGAVPTPSGICIGGGGSGGHGGSGAGSGGAGGCGTGCGGIGGSAALDAGVSVDSGG